MSGSKDLSGHRWHTPAPGEICGETVFLEDDVASGPQGPRVCTIDGSALLNLVELLPLFGSRGFISPWRSTCRALCTTSLGLSQMPLPECSRLVELTPKACDIFRAKKGK
jgi:hypothetical protein